LATVDNFFKAGGENDHGLRKTPRLRKKFHQRAMLTKTDIEKKFSRFT